MSSRTLAPEAAPSAASGAGRLITARRAAALALTAIAVALMIAGGLLPWVVVFNGLTAVRGFALDGGLLAFLMLAAVALLYVQAAHGGARVLRPIALAAAALVLADSLYSAWRISAYVAAPGPAADLTQPSAGAGPFVSAVAGAVLIAAAATTPSTRARLGRRVTARVSLAILLLMAAVIHLVLTPEHLAVSGLLGAGFLVAGLVQLAFAGFTLVAPDRMLPIGMNLVIVVDVALIVLYVYAVLVGLPFEAGHAADDAGLRLGAGEPVDVKGAIDLIAEAGVVGIAAFLARDPRPGT